jgi:hypothetical protein
MINKYALLLFFCLLYSLLSAQSQEFTLSGYIYEKGSKETIPGVVIGDLKTKRFTSSNTYGFFSLKLKSNDSLTIIINSIGYKLTKQTIYLGKDDFLEVFIEPDLKTLSEVVVYDEKVPEEAQKTRVSTIDIPIEQIKNIPMLLGEKDVLKTLQLLPGVQKGSEGSTGFYVRGGAQDQNLILLDEAPVYNANHLFGFFSIFNGDALKSVEFIKGGFPSRYGGRLSSVLNMQMKEGDKQAYKAELGLGLISSRATIEGPILKNKASFLISGRRTYIDAIAKPFLYASKSIEIIPAYFFYDLNAKLNYELNAKHRFYLSGYFGNDKFSAFTKNDATNQFKAGLQWGNATATARWNYLINPKLFVNTSAYFTNYLFNIYQETTTQQSKFRLDYVSNVRDFALKSDFDYYPNAKHHLKFGGISTLHRFKPSAIVIKFSDNPNITNKGKVTRSIESGLYIEDDYKVLDNFAINYGTRLSHYTVNGESFFNPEARFIGRYLIQSDLSVKGSFSYMTQYLHLLSNTGIGLPTDLWLPATKLAPPQKSWQTAAGIFKDFKKYGITTSIELYYKEMDNIIAYKDAASFLDIDLDFGSTQNSTVTWENLIESGKGWSYGSEFFVQKKYGRYTGWIGYTLSYTKNKFPTINLGEAFFAKYDRRHDIGIVNTFKVNDGITLSAVWVYGTGNRFTLGLSRYPYLNLLGSNNSPFFNGEITESSPRNKYKAEAYHRMDIGIQFHKQKGYGERTFEFSFYNAYNRQNPFFYIINEDKSEKYLTRVALFPIIPSFSWTLKLNHIGQKKKNNEIVK